jgi:hypothetical protein
MNKERLLDAAARLKLVEPNKFNLRVFTTSANYRPIDGPEDLDGCGSAACLLGWLPYWYPEDWEYVRGGIPVLRYGLSAPFWDGARWFGIDREEIEWLSYPERYYEYNCSPTALQVAARIERFVEESKDE